MLHSKARLLELNSKLAESLTNKGVMATADETTTSLINKVSDISSGGDDSILASIIDRSITSITIPNSVTSIGNNAFQYCTWLASITIHNRVTIIGYNAFAYCIRLTSIIIPDSVKSIGAGAFDNCTNLTSITIPDSVTSISNNAFRYCTSLTSITISDSVTSIGNNAFQYCSSLKYVTLGEGFNGNNLNFYASELIERETMVNMFNALADRTGLTAYKITINKVVGDKLTDEDKAIATVKNWTIIEQ